ncbi:MAG: HAD-IIIA family hydrolase, partial [Pseudomonadota bacterium]|nr:HAD-IIIA family hydrolase [Pseudomonadota bacterium]
MSAATIRQCVILAGGLGTRLGAITAGAPKPVLDVSGRPFLFWLMREMQRFGVEEFLVLSGYLSAQLEQAVRAAAASLPRPASIAFSVEPTPAGTGGALFQARGMLDERFLLCNGDSLFDCNLARLLSAAWTDGAETLGRMLLRQAGEASRYGVVSLQGDRVTAFHERPATGVSGLINAGVYALNRRILEHLSPSCSLERDVFPVLAAAGQLRGTPAEGWFIDIGVPEDLQRARVALASRLRRPALFLDRDGVLNRDHGYVGTRERWEWMPGALAALRLAADQGWHVFVVTNQAGVARGFYDEEAVRMLHTWMANEARCAGGTVDDLRYCPFHPQAPLAAYRRVSDCRKPGAGMLLDLIRVWDLDPGRCL